MATAVIFWQGKLNEDRSSHRVVYPDNSTIEVEVQLKDATGKEAWIKETNLVEREEALDEALLELWMLYEVEKSTHE